MTDDKKRTTGGMTETRKIQVSGNSTYLITLPKKWVEKVNLQKSDSIALLPLSNRNLMINPLNLQETRRNVVDEEKPSKIISIDRKDWETIKRKFIGAYLVGHNVLVFRSRKNLTKSDREVIKKISNSVMGTEIIDETRNSITVRDLLGKGGFSIYQALKRMFILSQGMFKDSVTALGTGDKDLMADVMARKEETSKFYWMVEKQYNFISKDIYFADKMTITTQEALNYLLLARCIDRIAYHSSKMSQNATQLPDNVPMVKKISALGVDIMYLMEQSVDSFYKDDMDFSNQLVSDLEGVQHKVANMNEKILTSKVQPMEMVSMAYILDSLERISAYVKDMAEIAINHVFIEKYRNRG